MTYDEAKTQIKAEQYWLIFWHSEHIIGYICNAQADGKNVGLSVIFPGSSFAYPVEVFNNYVRQILVPEKES